MHNTVLIVSKLYPPSSSARAIQVARVSRAIVSANYNVVVVAGREASKECSIAQPTIGDGQVIKYVPYAPSSRLRGFYGRCARRLSEELALLAWPTSWLSRVSTAAASVGKDVNPDVILTSSTPFECHLVGLRLKKTLHVPWVASFSDPWPRKMMPYPYNVHDIAVLEGFHLSKLRKVLSSCDAVHMTTEESIEILEEGSGIAIKQKAWVIPHVAPELDVRGADWGDGWVSHVGDLTRERICVELLEAARDLRLSQPALFRGIRFVGRVCLEFRDLVNHMECGDFVVETGHLPFREAMEMATQSSAVLAIEADMPASPFLPSKFVDYSATGRPIVAITPAQSPMRTYLNRYGGGVAVERNATKIKQGLMLALNGDIRSEDVNRLGGQFGVDVISGRYSEMLSETASREHRQC